MAPTLEPGTGEYDRSIVFDRLPDHPEAAHQGLEAAVRRAGELGGGALQLWIRGLDRPALAVADAVADRSGFVPYRDLWQMRVDLPTAPSDLPVRSFEPDDADALVAVNRRAFSWHPEQGTLTREGLEKQMTEPWFDRRGLLVHEIDGEMVGFCWTKVHADIEPPMGEIYVIGVDPAHHGRGIGSRLTRAGLDHLAGVGLGVGMLYVESDNDAAIHVYEQIGFHHHHTDRAYHRRDRAR